MRKKGFTLIEIIITIALIPIIVFVAYQLFSFGLNSYTMSQNEYELQSNMRMAVEKTNEVVKYSTSIFVIPKNSFREDNLDDEWDYIGISDDKKEIVQYISDGKGNKHKKNIIVPAQENIKFEVRFVKANPNKDDNLLKMIFVGINQRTGNEVMQIETQLTAVNSGFVKDYGSVANPGVAIAYRHDMIISEVPKQTVATITFVLDVSGSMLKPLDPDSTDKTSRIDILKDSLNDTMEKYAKEEDVEFRLVLIPFSRSANYPNPMQANSNSVHEVYNIKESSDFKKMEKEIKSFSANGGTNTGDGLRRAYHRTKSLNNELKNQNKDPLNFLIVLVDGVTTMASVDKSSSQTNSVNLGASPNHSWWRHNPISSDYLSHNFDTSNLLTNYKGLIDQYDFKMDDKGVQRDTSSGTRGGIAGNGSQLSILGSHYVNIIGEKIVDESIYEDVYVIGFSLEEEEMKSVNDIARAIGIPNPENSKFVFDFSNPDEKLDLRVVFDDIQKNIMQQIWRVDGPKY